MTDELQTRVVRRKRTVTPDPESPLPRELMEIPHRDPREPFQDSGGNEEFEDDQSPEDRVIELLQGISSDARAQIKVYRTGKTGTEYCGTFTVGEFEEKNLDLIREQFGAGEYNILMYGSLPNNPTRSGIRSRSRVRIAEPRMMNPGGAAMAPQANQLADVIRVMMENQRNFQESVTTLLRDRPDPMQSMRDSMALMTTMREAMGLNQPPAQRSSVGEIAVAIREIRGIASEIAPGKGEDDENSPGALIRAAMPIIQTVASKMGESRPAQFAAAPAPAESLPAIALPPSLQNNPSQPPQFSSGPLNDEDDEMSLALKLASVVLLKKIQKGEPVEASAEYVYDKMPDELLEVLEAEGWWEVFIMAAPQFEPHREYITAVRNRVVEMLAEDAAEEEAERIALPGAAPAP